MEELYHYGVVGMKWGVRHDRASRAFGKATKKANKLHYKSTVKNLKSAKLRKKALAKEVKATSEKQFQKARELQFKANKLQLKSAKLEKKTMKWEKSMEKAFREVKISDIKPEHLESGKKYAYMLLDK